MSHDFDVTSITEMLRDNGRKFFWSFHLQDMHKHQYQPNDLYSTGFQESHIVVVLFRNYIDLMTFLSIEDREASDSC